MANFEVAKEKKTFYKYHVALKKEAKTIYYRPKPYIIVCVFLQAREFGLQNNTR